jgi:sec-independent protein translocase protein TatA
MFPKFGPIELILILVIVTMLFGVGKLPELFGAVGRGVREFRKNAEEGNEDAANPTTNASDDKPSTDPTAPAA